MRCVLGLALAVTACTPNLSGASADAVAEPVVAMLRAFPEMQPYLASGLRFAARADGFEATTPRLSVHLPRSAGAPLTLSAGGVRVEVSSEALDQADGLVDDGVVVYRGAAPATDVAWLAGRSRVEEVRVLRDARAPNVAQWRVRVVSGEASIRLRDERVEVVGRDGVVHLSTDRMFAVDVVGVHRNVTVTLEGDRLTAKLDAKGLRYPVLLDPAWTVVASMKQARYGAAGALLPDGKVLIAGGNDGTAKLSTSEIYDPATNTWASGPNMANARTGRAIKLSSGKILVVGGDTANTSELYDPAAKTWTAATLPGPRDFALALHPTSGKVYAAGGYPSSAVQVYDPATNAWSSFASTAVERHIPGIVTLPNGNLFVHGGNGGTSSPSAEIYDFGKGAWSRAKDAPLAHVHPQMLVLAGKVHVLGGFGEYHVYDPATDTWSAPKAVWKGGKREIGFSVALLASTDILVFGGYNGFPAPDRYNQATDTWSLASAPTPAYGSVGHTMVQLPSERFLLVGGQAPGAVSTAEIFDLMANGAACTNPADCESGLCVDGVCCDSACTDSCRACDVTGSKGTCTGVPAGEKPHGARSCAPFATCAASGCAKTCAADADCVAGLRCGAGACLAKIANGGACTAKTDCTSGNCVDAVCCDTACAGQCESCAVAGKEGSCTGVSGAPISGRPACTGVGVGTACGETCIPAIARDKCSYPSPTTTCSGSACTDGIETHPSFCDGAGKCNDVPKSCAPYTCGDSACRSTCASNDQCTKGFYCVKGVCSEARSTCSADGGSIVAPEGTVTSCNGYVCRDGSCITSCTATLDCTGGQVCDVSSGRCIAPAAVASSSDEGGGCSHGGRPRSPAWLLSWMALALLRRRSK